SQQLAGLLDLVREGAISGKQAKDVYGMMRGTDQTAGQVVDKQGIRQITDAASIERVCAKVVQANPKQAEQYRKGKTGVLGFFVGQVMRETRGSASPQLVNDVLVRILSES
ncbi:MAG: Asp-tRNA(Asn)/Glu-tRNA(Gln) amidotransferase GatCAB subunit B, partial [Polyangiaceae bacterium]|nr:Asp-tRNA(Asn)/Glu-tRNA(Gln) amidotransferase GatCAB subunit B [Polyangiaceae bacterium]